MLFSNSTWNNILGVSSPGSPNATLSRDKSHATLALETMLCKLESWAVLRDVFLPAKPLQLPVTHCPGLALAPCLSLCPPKVTSDIRDLHEVFRSCLSRRLEGL